MLRCPTCEREFDPATVKSLPFCSPRCRQIDLGRWLGERIGIPVRHSQQVEDAEDSELAEGWGEDEEFRS
jgi:endogenous inhibitor of DNA gyrase (YacG/DUF329 family)